MESESNDCETTEGASSILPSGPSKPCRYGLECTRPNCKFGHGGQPIKYSASFNGLSSKNWVPPELHLKVLKEGGLICLKPEESQEESLTVQNSI